MTTEIQAGDYVAWRFGSGEARGRVVEKLTQSRKLNTRTFKASEEEPKFLIRSDKSGKEVIRKPDTLRKISENEEEDLNQIRNQPSHEVGGTESDDVSSHEDDILENKDGAAAVAEGKVKPDEGLRP